MKGHPRSTCPIPNGNEQKYNGASMTTQHGVPLQQFTPTGRPSSSQFEPHRRLPNQQSSFLPDSAASLVTALFPSSVFGVQPLDPVRLVAGIYQIPSTTIESFRTRALSNGIHCVPLKEEHTGMQNVDLARSTWIITGPEPSDVDSLVATLQPPRGLVSESQIRAVMQIVRDMDALHFRVLVLLFLFIFMFIAVLR
jgi:hypothetical protein